MFTISGLTTTFSGIIHLWNGYKKNQILKKLGANKKRMNKNILWFFAPQFVSLFFLTGLIPNPNDALLSFLLGFVAILVTSILLVLGTIYLFSLKLESVLTIDDIFIELPKNRLLFSQIFGFSPFTTDLNAINPDIEISYFFLKTGESLSEIDEIGKRFDELVELTKMKEILHGIKDLSEDEIKTSELLDKRMKELREFLYANRALVSDMVSQEGTFKRLKFQSETIKRLNEMNLESAEPLTPLLNTISQNVDPTIHELRMIQANSTISIELKKQAKELEMKVEERLKENKSLLSDDDIIRSKFDAIKMFHNL